MTEREFAIDVVQKLRDAGHQALWAGGCVRDEVLGLQPQDYDVATEATPEQVQKLFRRTVAVGVSFGVVEVLGPRAPDGEQLSVEVATFRSDGAYVDGRHPNSVVFSTPREDALRRDFTINGMFLDPLNGQVLDFVGGTEDLQKGILRAIGAARQRFQEDKLRMLRGVRIATRFSLTIEEETAAAIRAMADQIRVVSAERIADELRKLLLLPRRANGMRLFLELGLAAPILPELLPMRGLPQGPPAAPTGDLWDHVLKVLELLKPKPSFALALAALLHDVGKPRTVGRTPDRYTFYGHEHVGKRLTEEIADRLKLSNADKERAAWLVEMHQILCDARSMRTSKLKRLLAHPGIEELLELHRADAEASGRSTDHVDYCRHLLSEWSEADLNPSALVTGHDLMKLGLNPGPRFKEILDMVREAQLDGQLTSTKQALDFVRRFVP